MIAGQVSSAEVFDEPYPCQGCDKWNFCKTRQASCLSFYIYVTERGRLDTEHRQPTGAMYHRTFSVRGKPETPWEITN